MSDKEQSNIIIYTDKDKNIKLNVIIKDETLWTTQKQIAELFEVNVPAINKHIKNILLESELNNSTISKMEIVQTEGTRKIKREVEFYNLDMIIAVGYRVNSKKATQFRIWATNALKELILKGFVIDNDRLKNPNSRTDYFDELLEQIRDIRASEKRFYQKVRELFSLSSDYDASDKSTHLFFANTQNKLLYAITGKTASEIIVSRANASKTNMALTSFKGSIVRKQDIYTAKNYLTNDELDSLNRFVVVFLETAELRAKNRQEIKISFWVENIDRIIEFNDKEILQGYGSVNNKQMKELIEKTYTTFDKKRKKQDAIDADNQDMKELEQLEQLDKKIKKR